MDRIHSYYKRIIDHHSVKSPHKHHKAEPDVVDNAVDEPKEPEPPVKSEAQEEMERNGATVEIGFPLKSECQKRGDLSFYAYYTLWRNDRMPMYVVSCTSPKVDGKEHVEAAYSYFQKNKYPPTVRYDEASLEGKYTILMVDPDAPTAKAAKCRYWLHWAVTDVDGRHLRNGVNWMASEGRILKEYNPPTPPKASGPHRYQFLMFAQRYPYNELSLTAERCAFDPKAWATENKLELVASSLFITEYE